MRPFCVSPVFRFQEQSEKLLTWNLAVRDFHMLVNLVKVSSSVMWHFMKSK